MRNIKQKRDLSRFFTPEVVVEFMFDLVGFDPLWKVVDPACGDGAFLKEALRRGASVVAGVDMDPEAIAAAQENLHEFKVDEEPSALFPATRFGRGGQKQRSDSQE
jgi:predicted RNA methylase